MQKWGPITWNLFHTMAEKIKDDKYDQYFPELWKHFTRICHSLPCPHCSEHATHYIKQYRQSQFKNKELFFYAYMKATNDTNVFIAKNNTWKNNDLLSYTIKDNIASINHLYDLKSLNFFFKIRYKYKLINSFFKI